MDAVLTWHTPHPVRRLEMLQSGSWCQLFDILYCFQDHHFHTKVCWSLLAAMVLVDGSLAIFGLPSGWSCLLRVLSTASDHMVLADWFWELIWFLPEPPFPLKSCLLLCLKGLVRLQICRSWCASRYLSRCINGNSPRDGHNGRKLLVTAAESLVTPKNCWWLLLSSWNGI